MRALVARRRGLYLTEGEIGVLFVSFLFLTRVGVYVSVGVYKHTQTHTARVGYWDVSQGVGIRHLEAPKNPDGLNLGIYIFVYVHKVHWCMFMLGGRIRSWTNCFFLLHIFLSKKKTKRCERKPPIISSLK